MDLDPYSVAFGECLSELGSNFMQKYWAHKNTCSGSTDGPHSNSDMSGFQSLHSNDKAQRRNQNEATEGEGSSSSGSTDESHSNISGFHSLHSNEKPQKRTLGDIKSSQSNIMSQPGTLASTENASYAKDSNMTPGDNKSSQCSIMSRPGTLASNEDASYVKDPRVTVTLDPPVCEADTSNAGSKLNQNRATEGEGSSSSGSTDGSYSDISGFHSLHSNEQLQKRTHRDIKSSQYNIMSRPGTLASTEDASNVNDPKVTVTLAPPLREADTSNGGYQLNHNGATEGEGSSSSGSTDGSHLDISGFHSLHSNDRAQRRSSPDGSPRRDLLKPDSLSIKDVMAFALTGRTLSTESSNSDMSGCHSLHSNDEVEGRTSGDTKSSLSNIMSQPGTLASTENASYAKDSKVIPPIATLRSEKGTSSDSDDFSKPATLASTESAPCDDAPQSPQFLRSLSEVGSSSEISNWHSLRSTDRTLRRRRTPPIAALRSEKVTPSFSDDFSHPATLASTESAPCDDASQKYWPQFLRSLSEVGGSSEISNWHSLRSTDRTPRRPQLLRSLSEVGGSSKISNWHSLRSTDRTPRRRRLHST